MAKHKKMVDVPDIDVLSRTITGYSEAISKMIPWPTVVTILVRTPHDRGLDVLITTEQDPRNAADAILVRIEDTATTVEEVLGPSKSN